MSYTKAVARVRGVIWTENMKGKAPCFQKSTFASALSHFDAVVIGFLSLQNYLYYLSG